MNRLKILFKYPSRGRPVRFFDGLDSIYNNLYDRDSFHVSCTLDEDDEMMMRPNVLDRIMEYKNASICLGKSESKIHAVNRGVPDYPFDILVNMSDDMRFNIFGFDEMIRNEMIAAFPDLDGLLHFPDQDAKQHLATMYIAGRKWWEYRGRNIYHPSYKSLWCDNEEMVVAQLMGKYRYVGYQINEHLNPAYGHLERDEMFNAQQELWNVDQENYEKRRAKNFDL